VSVALLLRCLGNNVSGRAIYWGLSGEQAAIGIRYNYVTVRFVISVIAIGIAVAGSVSADDNVREVQEQLRDGGFYSGEIDGAYSSELSAALTRYQIRKGLAVTGQLDVDTSNALGAKPAVTKDRAAPEQSSSETWRRLRRGERRTSTSARQSETAATEARKTSSQDAEETESSEETQPRSAPAAAARTSSEITESASAPPPTGSERRPPVSTPAVRRATGQILSETTRPVSAPPATGQISSETTQPASTPPATVPSSSGDGDVSTERLRDYVGAFVLAGLDPNVGSEADFFADRVKYYDQGVIDREKIRADLQDYAASWPERHFWFVGNIIIEQQRRKRIRVTFPLRYELRNGAQYSSGTVNKTLVLEPVGDDFQIVAVSETKAE
jgi:Putative peptidoglycan binding domain